MNEQNFFLSCIEDDGGFLVYRSEKYRLSEIELLNLIKICIKEQRSKKIGRKILRVYTDAIPKKIAKEKLNKIGVNYDEEEPITRKKTKQK